MHPLVRDLYKRVLLVGREYPTGLQAVRTQWKNAMRNPRNCPSCYGTTPPQQGDPPQSTLLLQDDQCQQEIIYAVQRGRIMVKEMIGVIQLKKYRTMKQRYVSTSITVTNDEDDRDRNLPQCEEMNVTAVESSIEEKETAKREL